MNELMYPLGLRHIEAKSIIGSRYTSLTQDVVGEVERSGAGNTIIRVGRHNLERPEGGWQQVGHIVLTPDEREQLIADLIAQRS